MNVGKCQYITMGVNLQKYVDTLKSRQVNDLNEYENINTRGQRKPPEKILIH